MIKTATTLGALAALTVASVALAAPQPKATGDVTLSGTNQELNFSAFAASGSTAAKGSVTYTNFDAGISYTADVQCATVSGNNAAFTYTIPDGNGAISGLVILWQVHDGGTPGTNGDTAGFSVVSDPNSCPIGTPSNSYPVSGGNLVVH